MVRRLLTTVALAALIAGFSTAAFAALTPGQKMAVEALIKQFSAAEFDARQKAVDRLIELGPDVAPVVQKALADTKDNEVKLRCEMVLKGLKEKFPAAMTGAAATAAPAATTLPEVKDPGKFGLAASKVTMKVAGGELDEALAQLAAQSGNARVAMPKDWEGKPISVDVTNADYWEALDKLCASAGLFYWYDFQARGMALQARPTGADVSAYTGPVVVKLDSATLVKRFRPSGITAMMAPTDGLSLLFTYYTEDRLSPIEAEAEVTRITAADGKEIPLTNAEGPMGGRGGRGGFQRMMRTVLGMGGMFTASAQNPPPNADTLASVEGVVKLTFGAGVRELKIADALAGEEKTVANGNASLTVKSVQRMAGRAARGGRAGNNNNDGGTLIVSINYTVDGKEAEIPSLGRNSVYGITLIDPNGQRHVGNVGNMGGFFGFGGPGNPQVAAPAAPARAGAAPAQGNNPPPPPGGPGGPGEAAGATAIFANVPDVDGAWTLVLTVPEKTDVKDYAFKFANVSLR